jgi:hypothetical protein
MLQAEVAHGQTFPGLVAATSQSPLRGDSESPLRE